MVSKKTSILEDIKIFTLDYSWFSNAILYFKKKKKQRRQVTENQNVLEECEEVF